MATSLVVNGVSYLYPDTGDQSWGTVASAWASAITTGVLQKAGGTFTLTTDANFGPNFGLLSLYFTSQTANAAASGVFRLASTDALKWRNNANNADVALAKDSSDQLTWAGVVISSAAGVTPIAAGGTGVTSVTTSPTASAFAGWDANSNLSANAFISGFTSTATAAGTTTMTIASTYVQIWTGSTTQTVKLPTTSVVAGMSYFIVNNSSGVVTVQSSGGNTIQAMAASSWGIFTAVVATPTTAANWNASYAVSGGGTVTSVGISVPATSIFGTSGSPVTASGTLGITTAGTSGGIPYFSSTSALSSSALLTANQVIIGGGAGSAPSALAAGSQYQVLVMGASNPGYGQVNLAQSAAITGVLPIANGGTGSATVAAAKFFAGPTSGSNAAPSFRSLQSPTFQEFNPGVGGNTGYLFLVGGSSATVGDTYTANGNTYTVLKTITGVDSFLYTSGANSPGPPGTLTKATGSGDATIAFTTTSNLYTYTTPAGVLYLRIKIIGAGGGGGGSSTTAGANGVVGDNGGWSIVTSTSFVNLVSVGGGSGGRGSTANGTGGSGGTSATITSPAYGWGKNGGRGGANQSGPATTLLEGGSGASTPLAAGGAGGFGGGAGSNAPDSYSGAGGGGAGSPAVGRTGGGGGAGTYAEITIPGPSASYVFATGNGANGGTNGTSGFAGGTGSNGTIIVEEYYQ